MAFTGKARDSILPDTTAECLADLIGIISPYEIPLLDAIGDPMRAARSTNYEWLEDKARRANYTQIFTVAVEVSDADMVAGQLGLSDEMDYQKQERLRELLRDLENAVINGRKAPPPAGVGLKMGGIVETIETNIIDAQTASLNENLINKMLRTIWETSQGNIDLIVVGGFQKRRMNAFLVEVKKFGRPSTTYRDVASVYESDFGVCKIITTRWMPQDATLLLDSSRVSVLPLAGRSFQFRPLTSGGDYECGEIIGEYTIELKNESAHGMIRGLTIS